jgi:hypothetical protein
LHPHAYDVTCKLFAILCFPDGGVGPIGHV